MKLLGSIFAFSGALLLVLLLVHSVFGDPARNAFEEAVLNLLLLIWSTNMIGIGALMFMKWRTA